MEKPAAYFIEYNDGLRAAMLMLNGAVQDYTFAAELTDGDVVSTQFLLPAAPNATYSACLMSKVEEMITAGIAPYPVERTLLVSGMLEGCLQSRVDGHTRLPTPELNVCYSPPATSQYCEPGE